MLTGRHGGITVREEDKPVIYGVGEGVETPRTVKLVALMTFSAHSGGLHRRGAQFWTTERRAVSYEQKNLAVRIGEMREEVHEIRDESLEVEE